MEISNDEVLRYLGYSGADGEATGRVSSMVKELRAELEKKVIPKSVYGIWDCRVDSLSVELEGITINSKNLAKHLEGCSRAVLLAATLGPEADTIIRRYGVQDMEKAVIAQAVCAVMIEAYCDETEAEITGEHDLDGLYGTKRFSPGYGDFDIVYQKDILSLLACDRRIGLTLTSGYMLVPSKSITAVIGYAKEKKPAGNKCGQCEYRQCGFREKG